MPKGSSFCWVVVRRSDGARLSLRVHGSVEKAEDERAMLALRGHELESTRVAPLRFVVVCQEGFVFVKKLSGKEHATSDDAFAELKNRSFDEQRVLLIQERVDSAFRVADKKGVS